MQQDKTTRVESTRAIDNRINELTHRVQLLSTRRSTQAYALSVKNGRRPSSQGGKQTSSASVRITSPGTVQQSDVSCSSPLLCSLISRTVLCLNLLITIRHCVK